MRQLLATALLAVIFFAAGNAQEEAIWVDTTPPSIEFVEPPERIHFLAFDTSDIYNYYLFGTSIRIDTSGYNTIWGTPPDGDYYVAALLTYDDAEHIWSDISLITYTSGDTVGREFQTSEIYQLPGKVELASPGDGELNVENPVLSWYPTAYAHYYQLQVSIDSDDTIIDTHTADTSFQVFGLSKGESYRWRVRAHNIAGAGQWSGEDEAPQAGVTEHPSDRSLIVGRRWRSGAELNVPVPSNLVAGDYVYVLISSDQGNFSQNDITVPDGFLFVGSVSGATARPAVSVYRKLIETEEPIYYTFYQEHRSVNVNVAALRISGASLELSEISGNNSLTDEVTLLELSELQSNYNGCLLVMVGAVQHERHTRFDSADGVFDGINGYGNVGVISIDSGSTGDKLFRIEENEGAVAMAGMMFIINPTN